jgi:hypothetical protein
MSARATLRRLPEAVDGLNGKPPSARWRRRTSSRPPAAMARALPATSSVPRRRRLGRWLIGFAVLCSLATAGALASSASDVQFDRRLGEGCEEVEACRSLEAEAARRVEACRLGCGRERAEHKMARLLRYRAEERRAVHEHYRLRDDAERSERELEHDRSVADHERAESLRAAEVERGRAAEAERAHAEQLDLERLRIAAAERHATEERQRRLAYLGLLGPDEREQRLRHCFASNRPVAGVAAAQCEALIVDLVESAPDATEKRHLAELNERLLNGEAPVLLNATPKPKPVTPNS